MFSTPLPPLGSRLSQSSLGKNRSSGYKERHALRARQKRALAAQQAGREAGRTGRPPRQTRSADAADFISLPPELLQLCAGQLPSSSDVKKRPGIRVRGVSENVFRSSAAGT